MTTLPTVDWSKLDRIAENLSEIRARLDRLAASIAADNATLDAIAARVAKAKGSMTSNH